MVEKISRDQYNDLCQSSMWDTYGDFHKMLEETTGIIAKRYVAYQYYDSFGNYVGDSGNSTVKDLLNNAYIEIVDANNQCSHDWRLDSVRYDNLNMCVINNYICTKCNEVMKEEVGAFSQD